MKTLEIFGRGLSDMCRLCLIKDVELFDIFTFSPKLGLKIVDAIRTCAPVHISKQDWLPNFICKSCYNRLRIAYGFQKQAVTSEKTLQRYLKELYKYNINYDQEEAKSSKEMKIVKNLYNLPSDIKSEISDDIVQEETEIAENLYTLQSDIKSEFSDDVSQKIERRIPKNDIKSETNDCEKNPKMHFQETIEKSIKKDHTITSEISDDTALKIENRIRKSKNKLEPNDCNNKIPKTHFDETIEKAIQKDHSYSSQICIKSKKEPGEKTGRRKYDQNNATKKKLDTTETNSDVKLYSCKFCDKTFLFYVHLKRHKRIHSSVTYHCSICQIRCSGPSQLKVHMRSHSGEKPYSCEICDKRFAMMFNLNRHKRIHSGEKPYQCDICGKCFIQREVLEIHRRTHTGDKPLSCDVCDKRFSQTSALKTHKRIHSDERPYKCEVCDKCFMSSNELTVHKRVHSGERPYLCDICGKGFIHLPGLKAHKRVHSGEKPFRCLVCNKNFADFTNFKNHKRMHSGEKPFKCDVCDKLFAFPQGLKSHQSIHSGVKPYQCDVCCKCFRRPDNLRSHKRVHSADKT